MRLLTPPSGHAVRAVAWVSSSGSTLHPSQGPLASPGTSAFAPLQLKLLEGQADSKLGSCCPVPIPTVSKER